MMFVDRGIRLLSMIVEAARFSVVAPAGETCVADAEAADECAA
jgi:hypothetical protein